MFVQIEAGNEGLIAPDSHHDQQIGDHHHIDQAKYDEHDVDFGQRHRMADQMNQFLQELENVDPLGKNQAEIKRCLQPAAAEEQCFKVMRRMFFHGL